MAKFVELNEYLVEKGNKVIIPEGIRLYNLSTIQAFTLEGSGSKWYIVANPTLGRAFRVDVDGTPFATKEAATIARDVFIESINS